MLTVYQSLRIWFQPKRPVHSEAKTAGRELGRRSPAGHFQQLGAAGLADPGHADGAYRRGCLPTLGAKNPTELGEIYAGVPLGR